jgi:hypothetical protein
VNGKPCLLWKPVEGFEPAVGTYFFDVTHTETRPALLHVIPEESRVLIKRQHTFLKLTAGAPVR